MKHSRHNNVAQKILFRYGEAKMGAPAAERAPDSKVRLEGAKSLGKRILASGLVTVGLLAAYNAVEGGAEPDAKPTVPVKYQVQQGDTPWGISRRFAQPGTEIRDDVYKISRGFSVAENGAVILPVGVQIVLPEDLYKGFRAAEQKKAYEVTHRPSANTNK